MGLSRTKASHEFLGRLWRVAFTANAWRKQTNARMHRPREIKGLLVVGSLICSIIVAMALATQATQELPLLVWVPRIFVLSWMMSAWYSGLRELSRRRHEKDAWKSPAQR